MKKILFLVLGLTALITLSSCSAKVNLTLQKDGSLDVSFNGGAGAAFSKMILSATGGEDSFNINEIADELSKNGFSEISASSKGISEVILSFKDKRKSSFLFESGAGILTVKNNQLSVNLNRKTLKAFYDSADENLQMILDLFLAPVFNDEEMSPAEYLEMLGTFYGASAAEEVQKSNIIFEIQNPDTGKITLSYSIAELLCSN